MCPGPLSVSYDTPARSRTAQIFEQQLLAAPLHLPPWRRESPVFVGDHDQGALASTAHCGLLGPAAPAPAPSAPPLAPARPLAAPQALGQASAPTRCPWRASPCGLPHRPWKVEPRALAGHGPLCCLRRGACLSAFLLLLLVTLAALIALVTILGRPPRTPGAQACVTPTNRTGFLCHDRRSCIPASGVCDGVRSCTHGEDEDEAMCRDMPQSLPRFLVARCGDPSSWIYSDQKCDGTNNCGDCSDELSPVTVCPACGPGWWRCPSTVFPYCGCIPRILCRDRVQHCSDWSDEYSCPGP
ncbi:low-density lipoprotein receptor class A domain-containing protein 1 [Canis lupus baileyi]|uniref:low-density lipoprotein receptor class A domain-containing protein 1 n=1 Tax=Canis lupus baileyi TaxID=143281 RepID=UPI003B96B5C2